MSIDLVLCATDLSRKEGAAWRSAARLVRDRASGLGLERWGCRFGWASGRVHPGAFSASLTLTPEETNPVFVCCFRFRSNSPNRPLSCTTRQYSHALPASSPVRASSGRNTLPDPPVRSVSRAR